MPNFSYDEVARLLDSYGAQELGEAGYRVNYLYLNALSDLLDNKLTCSEMFAILDYYSDILLGKRPEIALLSREDRITGLCRLMTADSRLNSFSSEKREILAFSIYHAYCVQVFNEERQEILAGITDLSSLEKIMFYYNDLKERQPNRFPVPEKDLSPAIGEYGYSADNPIRMSSVRDSYQFLNRLVAEKGKIISCDRCGSTSGQNNHIVDVYEIRVSLGLCKKKTYTIYIDAYAQNPSFVAPQHFKLLDS